MSATGFFERKRWNLFVIAGVYHASGVEDTKAEIQTAGAWCISKHGPDGSRQQVFVVSPMLSLVLLAFCEIDH